MKTLKIVLPVMLVSFVCATKAVAAPLTPEISPSEGLSALALITGAVLVFRGRIKR